MSTRFRFVVLLTTLAAKLSGANYGQNTPFRQSSSFSYPSSSVPSPQVGQSQWPTPYLGKSPSFGSPPQAGQSQQPQPQLSRLPSKSSGRNDELLLSKIGSEFDDDILKMKGKSNGNNANPGEIRTCCEHGECRVIGGSTICRGVLSITSGGSKIPQFATSDNKLKSPIRDLPPKKGDSLKLEDNKIINPPVSDRKAGVDSLPNISDKSRPSVTSGNRPVSLTQIPTISQSNSFGLGSLSDSLSKIEDTKQLQKIDENYPRPSVTNGNQPASLAQIPSLSKGLMNAGENVQNPSRDPLPINLQPSLSSFKANTNEEETQKFDELKSLLNSVQEQEPRTPGSLNKSGSFGQLDNNMDRNNNNVLQIAEEPPRNELKSSSRPYSYSNVMEPKRNELRKRYQKLIPGTGGKYADIPEEKEVQVHRSVPLWNITADKVETIRQQLLKKANMYRNYYGFDSLTLNQNLNNYAQEWANKVARDNQMAIRPGNMYGENTFAGIGMKRIGAIAADQWFDEVRHILPSDGEVELATKYNSIRQCVQLLWKSTTEMGVGVSKSEKDNYYYIVADFNPIGNVQYIYLDNLPRFEEEDIQAAQDAYNWYQLEKKNISSWGVDHDPTSAEQEKSVENLTIGIPAHVGYRNEDDEDTRGNSPLERNTVKPTESPDNTATHKVIGVNSKDPRYELVAKLHEKIPPRNYPFVTPLNLRQDEVDLIRSDVFLKSNMYRNKYGMPPLKIDEQLNNYAQEWANTMATTREFHHRPKDSPNYVGYGENLHRSNECLHVGELGVDLWFYEVGLIHVDDSDAALHANDPAGHLLQLFWKASEDVGIGVAKDIGDKIYIVANYNPPGCAEHFYRNNIPRFTKDDIAEGAQKQAEINKKTRESKMIKGLIVPMPGWTSQMYDDSSFINTAIPKAGIRH